MLRVGIISNPFAKINKLNPEYNTHLWYTLANYGQFEVTRSLEQLNLVCQEFKDRNVNLVGIVGGDGSIGLVLSALYNAYKEHKLPKILLLKGGTINFLASNLGIKADAKTCLTDALRAINNKQTMTEAMLSTLYVNGRLGFIFANGIASSFLKEFYKNKTNTFGAALKVGGYIADGIFQGKLNGEFQKIVKHYDMNISTWPEQLLPKHGHNKNYNKYSIVLASTVPNLPLTKNFFKKVKIGDSHAEMLTINETGSQLVQASLKALMGQDFYNLPFIQSIRFNKANILCEANSTYSLDGDLMVAEDGKISFEMGPNFVFCSPYDIAK